MARDLSPDEAFDEKVAQLTQANFLKRMTMLRMGDPSTVSAISNAVAAEFADDRLMDELVLLAVRDMYGAGTRFNQLVEKVLRAEAEVDAIKDVEQAIRDAKDDVEAPDAPVREPVRGPWRYAGRL